MKCDDNRPARNERDKRPDRYGRNQLMPNMGVEFAWRAILCPLAHAK